MPAYALRLATDTSSQLPCVELIDNDASRDQCQSVISARHTGIVLSRLMFKTSRSHRFSAAIHEVKKCHWPEPESPG